VRLPGGIRTRIAITLAGIVAGSLAVAYVIVVPSLERQFVESKLDDLQEQARPLGEEVPENRFRWPEAVDRFAADTDARVVAYGVLSRNPPTLAVVADSRRRSSEDVQTDPIALRAAASRALQRGRVGGDPDSASVAIPIEDDAVLLFQASLGDSLATVRLVERRFLLAAVFALVLALVLGLTAATVLANRIRRLEAAAERIADGDFGAPIIDHGDDELGQLAVAFERMRIRLAQLDNARKEFVANASHELRTPLFSLGGFLELLTDEELDEGTRRGFLAAMQGQVERLAKLSTDLLDLSRVDAGQLTVAAEAVDLAEVCRTLVAELEPIAAGSDHELETDASDPVWSVADEDRVLQIGRALVVNALVHTPSGTRVRLSARRRGARAELAVEDDGPGIPEGHRAAVFERFYRVEGGKASGSGLGLAIAREVARLMGGIVRLQSRVGQTVFTLDLPSGPPRREVRTPVRAFSRENGEPVA
jgi:two-component system, OmpR family, sensor kinase